MYNEDNKEYYKLREEEVLSDFDNRKRALKQKINELGSKNDVINSQLAGHLARKEQINIRALEKKKAEILNEIDETEDALQKLMQKQNLFLKNRKKVLDKDLKEQKIKFESYLEFAKRLEKEVEQKKHEIEIFEKSIKSRPDTGKFIKIKNNIDKRVYKESIQKLDQKNKELIKFRGTVKEILNDPSKKYEGDNERFLDSFFSEYRHNPARFVNIKLNSRKYIVGGLGLAIIVVIALLLIILHTVPAVFPSEITSVSVASNGAVTVTGTNLGSEPPSPIYRDYPDFSLSDASGIAGAFEAGDSRTPDAVGISVVTWNPNEVEFFVEPNQWNAPDQGEHMMIKIHGSNWFYFSWPTTLNISHSSPQQTLPTTTVYPTSPQILFNFSENTLEGKFCLIPNTPYIYREYLLSKDEHATWVINQSMSISTEIILYNQSSFNNFVAMVENASVLYTKYLNTCNSYNTSAFCEKYFAQDSYYTPYRSLESSVQNLNPIMVALPSDYISEINFTAPSTSQYFFIILASRLTQTTFASSSICYANSYVYATN